MKIVFFRYDTPDRKYKGIDAIPHWMLVCSGAYDIVGEFHLTNLIK